MNIKQLLHYGISLILVSIVLAGCGGAPTEIPTEAPEIAATATAIPVVVEPTETVPQSGLQPLAPEACSTLADGVATTLNVAVTTGEAPFEDWMSGQAGTGCQASASGTGLDFSDTGLIAGSLVTMLQGQGWSEDINYAAGGPDGMLSGFRKDNGLCLLAVSSAPSDESLCSDDEPFFACWEKLTPEQQRYTITLNCVQDNTAAAAVQPEAEAEAVRIQFTPGTDSGQVQSSLAAGGIDRYVLTAMEGQEMIVTLSTPSTAAVSAVLVIWGADGTVLISDHADATSWSGMLPATQDYYIDVKSLSQEAVDYALEVTIPAGTDTTTGSEVLPLDVPVGFEFLIGLSLPVMLPPDFPVGEGLPAVQPYVYTAEPDEYEISLDFGPECQGAGACHYGSLAGKAVLSNEPVSTQNFEFDAARAQPVMLDKGIEGYFIESVCGANCDDAKVFWIYDGVQYMVGIKAAQQADVLAMANATLNNSIQ